MSRYHKAGILSVIRETILPSTTAFDPANEGSHVTLSRSNRTMVVGNGLSGSVLSSTSKSSGKWYFEWTTDTYPSAGALGMGIVDTNFTHEHGVGFDDPNNHSIGALFTSSNNEIMRNSVNVGSFMSGAGSTGDIMACAVDFDNLRVWFRNVTQNSNWNNSGTADPANNIGGLDFSTLITSTYFAAGGWQAAGASGQITVNFGNSFVGTRPNHFRPWGPSPVLIIPSTMNPTGASSNLTFSNGNLTITDAVNTIGSALSTSSKSSGKKYFEVTGNMLLSHNGQVTIGVAGASFNTSVRPGLDANISVGAEWGPDSSLNILINSAIVSAYRNPSITAVNGDVVGIAVDIDNKLIWYKDITQSGYWNNGATNAPGGTGGVDLSSLPAPPWYVAIGCKGNILPDVQAQAAINFGGSTFAQSVPSGFSAWDS